MRELVKKAVSIGSAFALAAGLMGASLTLPAANAKDAKAKVALEMGQDGSARLSNGALVGWNGWELVGKDGATNTKVNFVQNEDGSGTWYSLTEDGIDGKTSGAVDKGDVGKTVKQVSGGSPNLVDTVTCTGLEAGQKYTLKGALVAKFGDGDSDWGYVLNIGTGGQSKAQAGASASLTGIVTLAADDAEGAGDATGDGNGETETPGTTPETPGTGTGDGTGDNTDKDKDDTTTGSGDNTGGTETTPGDNNNTGNGDDKPAGGDDNKPGEGDAPSTGDNNNNTDNKDENNTGNTGNNNGEGADNAKTETYLYTYYNPADKKVYTRSVTDGKAEAVPSSAVTNVELDKVTGIPTNAVTAEKAFVAKNSKETQDNTFHSFDVTNAWEWTFVAFEQLYKGELPSSDNASNAETAPAAPSAPGTSTGTDNKDENGGTEAGSTPAPVAMTLADDGNEDTTGENGPDLTVYTFPAPLGKDTTAMTAALQKWQESINKGLRAPSETTGIQTTLKIYTDPSYETSGLTGNEMYLAADDARVAKLALGKVVIWTDENDENPVDAFVSAVEKTTVTGADDTQTTYSTYTLELFPTSQRVPADDPDAVVVTLGSGTSAANHIGNYGYFTEDDESFGFELMGMKKKDGDANGFDLTYNIYSFNEQKYRTVTRTAMYPNVIGNRYLDDIARPDWKTSAGVTSGTFSYDADLEEPTVTPPAATVTITFDSNGGTSIASLTGEAKTKIDSQTVATPTKEGYTFDGWWTQNGEKQDGNWGELKSAKNEDGTYNITYAVFPDTDVTLFAKWTKDEPKPETPGDDNNNNQGDNNNNNGNNSTDNDNKNGLVAKQEDPKSLDATVFFMSADEAKAEGDKYSTPETSKATNPADESISQMGDIVLVTLGALVGASMLSAGVLYMYRRRAL